MPVKRKLQNNENDENVEIKKLKVDENQGSNSQQEIKLKKRGRPKKVIMN